MRLERFVRSCDEPAGRSVGGQITMTGNRRFGAAGAALIALGIALGALAAHGFDKLMGREAAGWWRTGVYFQMWNGLGLVALGFADRATFRGSALLIGVGIVLFSFPLYLMAVSGPNWLGAIVPVGAFLMIVGWLLVAFRLWRRG